MKRLTLALVVAAAAAFVSLPAWADQTAIIPFHSNELVPPMQFHYTTYPHSNAGDLPDGFYLPSFDDGDWGEAGTPFSSSQMPYCAVSDSGPVSPWGLNGDVLVRAKFPLCANVTNVQILVKVDNSVGVWMNGTQLMPNEGCEVDLSHSPEGLCDFENCADDHIATFDVDPDILHFDGTPNLLAIEGCDHGVMSFLDFAVMADLTDQVCPCEDVVVSPAELWPPNHKFTPVTVKVGETLATITSVWQDEPTLAPGDKCPDAAIINSGLAASLRVERLGGADGRIYHLGFDATTPSGYQCTGTIGVCVPHDQGMEPNCVDGGALYNSMLCN